MVSKQVIQAVVAYSAASASMLVLNKVVLKFIPMPSLVTSIQFTVATVICLFLKFNKLAVVDDYKWENLKPYMYYIAAFVSGIYCNMKTLENANVETVIVFRTCSPIIVAVLDWLFLGRSLPTARSLGGLLLIVVGAICYVLTDKQFAMEGISAYSWVIAYLLIICFEMTYGKHIIKSVKMQNKILGAVFYTNSIAIFPMLFLGFGVFDEGQDFGTFDWTFFGIFFLFLSCIVGTCISYAAFNCRDLISATSFTVVGVVNKMITILINVIIWDDHASFLGICSLMLCIAGGTIYRQAPLRSEVGKGKFVPHEDEEVEPMVEGERTGKV